jgi:hypothetical protein
MTEVERKEEKRTWMLSWSDRQGSIVTMSGWPGARTVERDLPPNMREMGDSTELAYSCPCMRQPTLSEEHIVSLSHLSLALDRSSLFFKFLYTWSKNRLVHAYISGQPYQLFIKRVQVEA